MGSLDTLVVVENFDALAPAAEFTLTDVDDAIALAGASGDVPDVSREQLDLKAATRRQRVVSDLVRRGIAADLLNVVAF